MSGADVLLNVPTESVMIRAIVASVVGLVLVRLLLRTGLRTPRARAVAVLVPTFALALSVLVSWRDVSLPSLMISVDETAGVIEGIRVGDRYLDFMPLGWPLVLGAWALIAGCRIGFRVLRVRRVITHAGSGLTLRDTPDARTAATVERVAARLRIPPPPVAVVEEVGGGAAVVGLRRCVMVVDRALAAELDDEELEGLVAHELAHVRRRDNLISLVAGVARDVFFFVPGSGWVLRHFHSEREVAADQLAVDVTGRPGALASGLLKVLRSKAPDVACAAFAPSSASLEARVRRLCETPATTARFRRVGEVLGIGGIVALAVVAAVQLPAALAERAPAPEGGRGDVLAVLWSHGVEVAEQTPPPEPAAFRVYRANGIARADSGDVHGATPPDDGRELNPAVLRVDPVDGRVPAERVGYLPMGRESLGLTPAPRTTVDPDLVDRWRATALFQADEGLSVYWLSKLTEVSNP